LGRSDVVILKGLQFDVLIALFPIDSAWNIAGRSYELTNTLGVQSSLLDPPHYEAMAFFLVWFSLSIYCQTSPARSRVAWIKVHMLNFKFCITANDF